MLNVGIRLVSGMRTKQAGMKLLTSMFKVRIRFSSVATKTVLCNGVVERI